ncbi:hypothetical protein QIH23_27695, partial [Klebsiella pneumoniae]|nr:hypothetical protein [Klebsiella pneumoniae]
LALRACEVNAAPRISSKFHCPEPRLVKDFHRFTPNKKQSLSRPDDRVPENPDSGSRKVDNDERIRTA